MVNTEDFIKRLEIIFDYYSLNASAFADKIGVQRSSLSHLLSGRNKPSLDFIMKILEEFPDVDLYWILNGTGTFPKSERESIPLSPTQNSVPPMADLFTEDKIETKTQPAGRIKEVDITNVLNTAQGESKIDKIVVFYSNGTFKSYLPE